MHGWHIDMICAHLQAITTGFFLRNGLQNRLQFNVPPGMAKSLLVSVFWPAWEWAYGFAHHQYIVTAFREDNCKRDTRRMRDLVMSDWYQALYGKDWVSHTGIKRGGVKLIATGDERISNTAGGWREGLPFGSLTGSRGDRLIIDDPHSTKTAESDVQRAETERIFRSSATSRVNDPQKSAIVLIMQRLHVNDLCGVIDRLGLAYVKVVLPMRFEVDRACQTIIARDPRTVEGELLFPQRFPNEVVTRDEATMTAYDVAGQFQQRPYLREGAMFKRVWFVDKGIRATPARVLRCRGWDLAGTKKKQSAYSAGVLMAKAGDLFIIEHAIRERGTPAEVKKLIKGTAERDPVGTRISIPQDPGQAGIAQRDDYAAYLAGRDVRFSPESGEKRDRARPVASQAEVGNLRILVTGDPTRDAWIGPYLEEIYQFPGGTFKDQTDATSRAFAELLKMEKAQPNQGSDLGIGVIQVDRTADDSGANDGFGSSPFDWPPPGCTWRRG